MLSVDEVRAIAEQFIRQKMAERHSSVQDESILVESLEIDIKYIKAQRLTYLVQAIATERIARWMTVRRKGLINRLLGRREQVRSRSIPSNTVRFQLLVDASNGDIVATDVAPGKGGVIDPFFDMKHL